MTKLELARLIYAWGSVDAVISQIRKRVMERPASRRRGSVDFVALDVALGVRETIFGSLGVSVASNITMDLPYISVMRPSHDQWDEFCRMLEGPKGCNFQKDAEGRISWKCHHDFKSAKKILRSMGCDLPTSLTRMRMLGGHCDCEILFNVERSFRRQAMKGVKGRAKSSRKKGRRA